MVVTEERRVLYRQGSGFWRMTAKWVLVFGVLALVDGGLVRSWGDALVWPVVGVLLWVPFGIGVVWYSRKEQLVTLTPRGLRVWRKRLPMEKVNLLHVARLWLEGRSTADDRPVAQWSPGDRVVWVPLLSGRAYGVHLRDPAAFAGAFGDFAVAACGGPDAVRARAAETYRDPVPLRPRRTGDAGDGSRLDLLDILHVLD
ncbi:hypothetical protein ACIPW5_05415 [Streptomyces sp. NPDC090077]|uniref:hypothetical protein n=1 Tax=Streptomyces sp. NPDC090077 TaxID=3365938 RepID=UPI00380E5813